MRRIISVLSLLGVFMFLSQLWWVVGNTLVWIPLRILLILGFAFLYMKWPRSEIGLTTAGLSVKSLVSTGLVTGVGMYVFIGVNSLLYAWGVFGEPSVSPSVPAVLVVRAVLLGVVLAPILEELYYRGFLCALLRDKYTSNVVLIMMATAIVFSLGHLSFSNLSASGLLSVVLMIPVAAVLARLFLEKGSLIPVIVAHMVINLFDIVVTLSSGGSYGGFILSILLISSVIALVLRKDVLFWLRDFARGTARATGVVVGIVITAWSQLCTYGGLYVQKALEVLLGRGGMSVSPAVLWVQRVGLITVLLSVLYLILEKRRNEGNHE
jgi:membrane protease YdiL (CAAX protease family)